MTTGWPLEGEKVELYANIVYSSKNDFTVVVFLFDQTLCRRHWRRAVFWVAFTGYKHCLTPPESELASCNPCTAKDLVDGTLRNEILFDLLDSTEKDTVRDGIVLGQGGNKQILDGMWEYFPMCILWNFLFGPLLRVGMVSIHSPVYTSFSLVQKSLSLQCVQTTRHAGDVSIQ